MKILLTNDDGYDAPGLCQLFSTLEENGHDVCIVAPLKNRSGASSSVNIFKKQLLVRKSHNVFALDGSPVDCVISALKGGYIPFKPDVVISGINNDGNLGTDVIYSGTCGAAKQACLYGIPSIALSVERMAGSGCNGEKPVYNFKNLAEFASKNLDRLIDLCLKHRNIEEGDYCTFFVNVNAPSIESYRGVRLAELSRRDYKDSVEITKDTEGNMYSTCVGGDNLKTFGRKSTDFELVCDGYVSISVLHVEAVADNNVDFLENSFL